VIAVRRDLASASLSEPCVRQASYGPILYGDPIWKGKTLMRVFTTLPQEDLRNVGAAAKAIEADGYDGVASMENKHDPFLALAVAGTATERIELHTSVAIAFARSPMAVASVGWDLASATGGRFVVGLGSQVRAHNERRFSVPWTPPAPRMREYVQALRAIWHCWRTGERLSYEGEHYRFTLMTPNFTPEPIEAPAPPVTIAAVGPAMLKVAAEECDGVKLHGFCTRKYIEAAVMPRLAEGLAKARRKRENYEISGGGFLAMGPDDATVARMFEWVRERVAFYGSTQAYWPVLALHGLEDLGHKLNAMTRQGKWAEMAKEVPDDVVHLFAAVGRYDQIKKAIADRFGGLTDAINARANAALPGPLPPDLIHDIRRIPHAFRSFSRADA
jgi:probable F420-dependent oxidoreductase